MHAQEAPAPAAPQPTSTGPAQQRSVSLTAAETTGLTETTYRHSASLVGPATPRRWRQSARHSTPAIHRARAHARKYGNNPRPMRLGCTPRQHLHPRRHSLRPPGRPRDAQCHSLQHRQQARRKTTCALQRQTIQRGPAQQHLLQWRQPAQQTIDTANHRPAQQRPCGRDNRPGELHLSKSTPPLCSPPLSLRPKQFSRRQ